jgi:hypothetical protein
MERRRVEEKVEERRSTRGDRLCGEVDAEWIGMQESRA